MKTKNRLNLKGSGIFQVHNNKKCPPCPKCPPCLKSSSEKPHQHIAAPTVVKKPASTVVTNSAPTVVKKPASTVVTNSAPTLVTKSAPTLVTKSAPTLVTKSAPTVVRNPKTTPARTYAEVTKSTSVSAPAIVTNPKSTPTPSYAQVTKPTSVSAPVDINTEINNIYKNIITVLRQLMNDKSTNNKSELKKLLHMAKNADSKIENALINIDNAKEKTLEASLLKLNSVLKKNCSGWIDGPKCAMVVKFLPSSIKNMYEIIYLFDNTLTQNDKNIKITKFINIAVPELKKIIDSNTYPELQQFSDNVNAIYKKLYTKGGKKIIKRKKTVKRKKNR